MAVALVLVLSATVVFEAGCGSGCLGSCAGPWAEITSSAEIAVVEVCDRTGACTRQEFGPPSSNVIHRSFTVAISSDYGSTSSTAVVTLRGWNADGELRAVGEAESKFGKSGCGCPGPARFVVQPNHVGAAVT